MTRNNILDKVNEIIIYIQQNKDVEGLYELQNLKFQLLSEIQMTEAKKNGKDNILKVFKSILKNSIKTYKEHEELHAIVYDNGQYIVCDGFQLLVHNGELNVDCVSIPEKYINYKDILKFFSKDMNKMTKLELPSLSSIEEILSKTKAENKLSRQKNGKNAYKKPPLCQFDDISNMAANANFMKNMVTAGITKLYYDSPMFYGCNDDQSIKYVLCGCKTK